MMFSNLAIGMASNGSFWYF
ncbi:hypothetical protein F383_34894 [Gossypium arboreum]|uniref:Uncharacterized protein n=1 Tax=Gossypium arboreum TaxID=29729 RepID=A0A0B0N5E7_GOSAR|nr:hypothetical protein F383_34894 [Gossypium arboreum]